MDPNNCTFVYENALNYTLGCILVLGIFLSYIFQYVSILKVRSSEGISWISIFLLCSGTFTNTLNAILEKFQIVSCCRSFTFLECNASLLSIYQIGSGAISTLILYLLVLIFFPADKPGQKAKFYAMIGFTVFCALHLLFVILGIFFISQFGSSSLELKGYAFTLGLISTIENIIQWCPQIFKTWKNKDIGSFSIVMLLIQTPGSFIVVFFQAFMEYSNLSTWFPYFVTGILQIILLLECIFYESKKRFFTKSQIKSLDLQDEESIKPLLSKETNEDE